MSKEIIINPLERSLKLEPASDNFKLDEIQWDNHYPVHPELIPFESITEKIIKELGLERAQAVNKLHNS